MPAPIINLEELLSRIEDDHDLLRDLLSVFKEEFPRRRLALRDAVAAFDTTRAAAEAHAMKGMLSSLAAREAAKVVSLMESQARNGNTAGLRDSFSTFEKISDELLQHLDSCLAEVSG